VRHLLHRPLVVARRLLRRHLKCLWARRLLLSVQRILQLRSALPWHLRRRLLEAQRPLVRQRHPLLVPKRLLQRHHHSEVLLQRNSSGLLPLLPHLEARLLLLNHLLVREQLLHLRRLEVHLLHMELLQHLLPSAIPQHPLLLLSGLQQTTQVGVMANKRHLTKVAAVAVIRTKRKSLASSLHKANADSVISAGSLMTIPHKGAEVEDSVQIPIPMPIPPSVAREDNASSKEQINKIIGIRLMM